MTTIAGFAEGIPGWHDPAGEGGEALNVVVSETRRLSRLVRRMLDLSRLNALTETVTAQEQFDIIEVMSRVLVSLEGRDHRPGPGCGRSVPGGSDHGVGRPGRGDPGVL